ncbi:PAS domain S-box-containing protein [Desulfonatronum zhilinae]|nr:PAS domain S-box-containing protein [Desulfonatronum zhilinae]
MSEPWATRMPSKNKPVAKQKKQRAGNVFPLEVAPRYSPIGDQDRVIAVVRDISERKAAEKEREELQAQLLQAHRMESVGILAGGVAHEFNNLLHAISGNMELLLRDKPADHPDAHRLRAMSKSLDRAGQLVRQLLLFSRKAESRRMRVDLNQEVECLVRMLEQTISQNIVLDLRLYPLVWPLFADPVQIEQVLLNLAKNAADAMPEGGRLTIETRNVLLDDDFVRAHPGSTSGRHVLLSVTDTGCGMDEKTCEHIFEPFFTTKEVGKGTGLGLATAYGIVMAHGGYIHCASKPDQGATFRIYLPAKEMEDTPMVEPRTETSCRIGNAIILVVDDDQAIRELTQEALEGFGYSVLSAATGEEALEIFKAGGKAIDLVLLDLIMPGMGGYKCLQKLLQLNPLVKVVVASGYSPQDQSRETLKSGAMGLIGKPYQLKELESAVRKALEKKPPSATSPER